jgi:predicted RNA-binding protein with RPS1 domain
MKIKDIKDAAKKKAAKQGKVIDIKEAAKKKEMHIKQLKKLQEVRIIARKMGIDTRNVTLTELIRAIQRTEGNRDCYLSAQVLECEQTNCLWRETCAPF